MSMGPDDPKHDLDALDAQFDSLGEIFEKMGATVEPSRSSRGLIPGRRDRTEEFAQRIQRLEKDFVKLCDALKPRLFAMDSLLRSGEVGPAQESASVEDVEALLVSRLDQFVQQVSERLEALRLDLDLQRSLSEGLNQEFRKDVDSLRAEFQARAAQDEENQRKLEEALRGLQRPADPEVQEDIRILQREVLQIRRGQDAGLLQLLESQSGPDDAEEADADELPGHGVVTPDALYDVAARLEALLTRGLSPEFQQKVLPEIEHLQALASDLELEGRLRERASEILKLLLPRLLEQGPADRLHQRARRFVFVKLPDLLEDLEELGRRDLPPEHLGPLHNALEGILEDVGLEEIRPMRGDTLKAAEHSLLRVERSPEPGLEGRIANCLRPGLRLRASQELVRKAEVSVYP